MEQEEEGLLLSIQFGQNGLVFCLLDTIKNRVLDVKTFDYKVTFSFDELFRRFKLALKEGNYHLKRYEKIYLIHNNSDSTFVPLPYFKKTLVREYLTYNSRLKKKSKVNYDQIFNTDIINVYIEYHQIASYIKEIFNAELINIHYSTLLLRSLFQNIHSIEEGKAVLIDYDRTNCRIIVLENYKLLFYNTFYYEHENDFIYYILLVLDELNLDRNKTTVHIVGNKINIDNGGEKIKILDQYVQKIKPLEIDNSSNIDLHPSIDKRNLVNRTIFMKFI